MGPARRRTFYTSIGSHHQQFNLEEPYMKRNPVNIDIRRRALLKLGAAATVAACAGEAAAQGAPHVDENDAQAQALGYKHDATKVDTKKFANYQPGQTCAN